MTKSQIKLAWKKVAKETHKVPDWDEPNKGTVLF